MVAYERVSTARQGANGLGLEAQRKVIADFAVSRGAEILARFTEVESFRRADRPELVKALHLAKVTGATLVIAKLDRLSRNAAFLLTLRDSGVRFLAVDMPEAKDLTVGIMALVAQAEREAISRRTKEALAVAKARAVKLGNPNGAAVPDAGGQGRCGPAAGCQGQRRGLCVRSGPSDRRHSGQGSHLAARNRGRADFTRNPDTKGWILGCRECERGARAALAGVTRLVMPSVEASPYIPQVAGPTHLSL